MLTPGRNHNDVQVAPLATPGTQAGNRGLNGLSPDSDQRRLGGLTVTVAQAQGVQLYEYTA